MIDVALPVAPRARCRLDLPLAPCYGMLAFLLNIIIAKQFINTILSLIGKFDKYLYEGGYDAIGYGRPPTLTSSSSINVNI